MAIIKSDFICDLNRPVKVQYLDGNLFSQDNMGNVFNVYVMDGDTPAVISGSVTADVIRSDGATVPISGTISDNVCTVVFPQTVYAVPGVVSIVIKLTNNGTTTTLCAVVANVFRSSTDAVIDPGTIIPSIQTLIAQINTAVASIPADYSALWAKLAPPFSTDTNYPVGRYVTYNGGLYRFVNTHSGAWVTDDVKAVDIGGELETEQGEINELNMWAMNPSGVNLAQATIRQVIISSSSGKWTGSSGSASYIFSIPSGAKRLKVVASIEKAVVALLSTNDMTVGNYPNYATGCGRETVNANGTREFIVPSDAHYITIMKSSGGTDYTPSSVLLYNFKDITVDNTLTNPGAPADAKTVGDELQAIKNLLFYDENVDLLYGTLIATIINTSNKWSAGSSRHSYLIPVSRDMIKVTITANSEYDSTVALLASTSHVNGTNATYATGCARVVVPSGETAVLSIPSDCVCLYVVNDFNDENRLPSSMVWTKYTQYDPGEYLELGLHEKPENQGVLNVIKRCRQMTDIKWTPAVDLPRMHVVDTDESGEPNTWYIGKFEAGVEYTGIPYGRAYISDYGYDVVFFRNDVSFETFVSAVENAESLVCKEAHASLAYHRSIPYATVCSGMTCRAINVSYVATANIPSISGMNYVCDVISNGVRMDINNIKLADILNYNDGDQGHTSIITDIIRDLDGNIIFIEESEETAHGNGNQDVLGGQFGGVCRRVGFDVDGFFERYGNYKLYRYSKIGNVPYTPDKFVNVGNEFNMARHTQFPCMPYPGEGFKYKYGYIPNTKILVLCTGYSFMRVFKDGVEVAGSPFAITNDTKYVEVGFSETGSYEAYLCNMSEGEDTKTTLRCHWSVV